MTATDTIAVIMLLFFIQTLCFRHFWLRSEELEEENKELRQRLKDARLEG